MYIACIKTYSPKILVYSIPKDKVYWYRTLIEGSNSKYILNFSTTPLYPSPKGQKLFTYKSSIY